MLKPISSSAQFCTSFFLALIAKICAEEEVGLKQELRYYFLYDLDTMKYIQASSCRESNFVSFFKLTPFPTQASIMRLNNFSHE